MKRPSAALVSAAGLNYREGSMGSGSEIFRVNRFSIERQIPPRAQAQSFDLFAPGSIYDSLNSILNEYRGQRSKSNKTRRIGVNMIIQFIVKLCLVLYRTLERTDVQF
jgi:murein endopeptidase